MNKYRLTAILIIVTLMLNACAAPQSVRPNINQKAVAKETLEQKKLLLQSIQKDNARLSKVAFPLLTKNTEFCGKKTAPMDGISAWTLDMFPKAEKNMMHTMFGLTNALTISAITANSPAAKAGLRRGDIIVAVNGVKIPEGKKGLKIAHDIFLKSGTKQSQIMIKRGGKILTFSIKPVLGCNFPTIVDRNDSKINAYADGKHIIISKGMMRFVESDTELALVIAHELAHNTMGHINKKKINTVMGAIGGLAMDVLLGSSGEFYNLGGQMGALAHSVAFEQEADYIGMYYMARAGYNIDNVAYFWRRMAVENGGKSIYIRTTHPTSPERFLAIEKTVKEIKYKKSKRQKLTPNLKRTTNKVVKQHGR